jgi:hypothetical protein
MKWTKEDDYYLIKNYGKHSVSEIASHLNRSKQSIMWRVHHLRINKVKRWTKEDEDYLIKHYANTINSELGKVLGRNRIGIIAKASKLGLKKDDDFIKELGKRPNSGQFQKGHKNWCLGLKFPNREPQAQWFKKGQVPYNKLPDEIKEVSLILRKLKRKLNGKKLSKYGEE